MRSWIKKLLLIFTSILTGLVIILLPFLFFIKTTKGLVFGNFQSYISSDLQNELIKKYGLTFQYYGTNAEIPTYIKNKTLDIAIATNNMIGKLALDNEIQEINWEKFNLENVKSYEDLKNIVTDSTWTICETIGKAIGIDNLLKYCVPYFMQKFLFAYRGNEITELQNSSYEQIFQTITNPNFSRFSEFSEKNGSVMMIKDARSIYNISRLMNNQNINPNTGIITSKTMQNKLSPSINDFLNSYNSISNFYTNINKNAITFNTDSSIVLNKLSLNQISGAFLYNGDVIYSAINGDNPETAYNLPKFDNDRNFWTVEPEKNFYALDGFVINKNLTGNRLEKAYEIIENISLSGLNSNNIQIKENGEYVYDSMKNFKDILYTPCYKKIYDYATGSFFDDLFPNCEIKNNFLKNTIKIENNIITENNLELPLNDLADSNINIAFDLFIYYV